MHIEVDKRVAVIKEAAELLKSNNLIDMEVHINFRKDNEIKAVGQDGKGYTLEYRDAEWEIRKENSGFGSEELVFRRNRIAIQLFSMHSEKSERLRINTNNTIFSQLVEKINHDTLIVQVATDELIRFGMCYTLSKQDKRELTVFKELDGWCTNQ